MVADISVDPRWSRLGDSVTRNAEFGSDGTFRQLFAVIEMPDQCPVFHGDHPFNLGWVA